MPVLINMPEIANDEDDLVYIGNESMQFTQSCNSWPAVSYGVRMAVHGESTHLAFVDCQSTKEELCR